MLAGKIAPIRHFHHGKARMLLMIGAETTIIGAPIMGLGVEGLGVFRGLVVIPNVLVIGDVVRNQHLGVSVFLATFEHVDLSVLEYDLGIYPS